MYEKRKIVKNKFLFFVVVIIMLHLCLYNVCYPEYQNNKLNATIESFNNANDPDVQRKLLIKVAEFKYPDADKALIHILNECTDVFVEVYASAALVIYDPVKYGKYIEQILHIVNDAFNDIEDRVTATEALLTIHFHLKDTQVLKYLIRLLRRESAIEIQTTIITSLSKTKDHNTKRILAQHLAYLLQTEQDEDLRSVAVKVLANMKSVHSFNTIKSLLNDMDEDIRLTAINSLVQLKDPRAIPLLYNMILYDETYEVRMQSKNAMEELIKVIPNKRFVISALIKVLNDAIKHKEKVPFKKVRDYLYSVVKNVKPNNRINCITPLIKALRSSNKHIRIVAATALGHLGDEKAVRLLRQVYRHDRSKKVKKSAKNALKQLGFFE